MDDNEDDDYECNEELKRALQLDRELNFPKYQKMLSRNPKSSSLGKSFMTLTMIR
jgi:hypothetical protein